MTPISQPINLAIMLDTEPTGLDPLSNHAIEIAFKIVNLTSGSVVASYQSVIKLSAEEWKAAHPKALEVNRFTWDENLQRGKPRELVRKDILEIFQKNAITKNAAVFLCQNPSFDKAFFSQIVPQEVQTKNKFPYHWLDLASMDFAFERAKIAKGLKGNNITSLSKDNIAKRHNLPPEEQPHRAMNGVDHLNLIFTHIIGFGNSNKREGDHLQQERKITPVPVNF
jgi:DNA polymerase-3 subunit epsilon/oligoribonuclease